jgi:predicted RNase H-like nuclease (RuvC/YqgF family)
MSSRAWLDGAILARLSAAAGGEAMDEQKNVEELKECQETVESLVQEQAQLKEENRHLRQAAGVFGQLAERLNVTLREERRKKEDRRRAHRTDSDRRRGAAATETNHSKDEW